MQFAKIRTMRRMNAVLAAAVLWGLMPGVASAVIINVPGDHLTIQGAIGAAAVSGDEIIVAPGTYPEVINFLGKAINLHSASGNPADTIIDGTGMGVSVVICNFGEGPGTILEGFTITGGNHVNGGGMINIGTNPTVTNCIFSGNTATSNGGGMFNSSSGNPTVTNCTFSGNTAQIGGGMYNFISNPIVTNCNFSGNTGVALGGGMYNVSSDPEVTGSTFSVNEASNGGGMFNISSSNPSVANCTFDGNTATDRGGGMYNTNSSSPDITDCTFSLNSASSAGGMYNQASNLIVTNCTFSGNSATAIGGGMLNVISIPIITGCTFSGNSASLTGGGMYNTSSNPEVTGSTFSGNSAGSGGGMYNSTSNPSVTNCIFSGNSGSAGGGGIRNALSSPIITNCSFSGNSASNGGGMLNGNNSNPIITNCILWGDSPNEFLNSLSTPTISFSNVQGGFVGTGNINLDPLFVDATGPDTIPGTADDDLRLLPGSPCVDAGNNAAPGLTGIATDLDGLTRILFTTVDMGAYERQTIPPSTDTDGDGLTDAEEIALAQGSGCPDPLNADSDGDGLVDGVDPLPCNAPPFADAVVEQLTDIGANAVVRLDASSSSDPESPALDLTYEWIVDGVSVCSGILATCQTIEVSMSYGVHTVILRVTDPAGDFDEVTTTVTLDPAELTVLEIDKVKVKFNHDPPEIEIKGKIGLPFGVNFTDVLPLATITLDMGGSNLLVGQTLLLTPETDEPEEWEYRDETALLGIRKFDIDWKGARFKFKEEDLGIKLKSQIITPTETVLTFKYKMEDINGAFSMSIGGLATVNVDAEGVATADVPFEVEDEGEEIVLTLPFGLNDTMVITLAGSINASINVVDHLKASIGRFRLKARFDGAAFPNGAATAPRKIDLFLMIGAQFYPGETTLGQNDLKVKGNQWKAKRGD